MKKLVLGSVLALSSVFTVTACTSVNATTDTKPATSKMQQKDSMKKGMKGPMSELDLTATQQAQIKAIMEAKKGDRKADREKHKAERAQMHQQMQALTNASTLNTAAVNRLADQEAAKTKQRFIERVQTEHAISQVLTVEQREKMAKMKADKMAKGSKHDKEHKGSKNDKEHKGM